ncbi:MULTISPECIES: ABC transporter ATP-binding protein [unclassified Pantoea]|uniref:ABC transporter ATP-binding protein n=1 Tax=unclassified Pantoea TaxID=2630326 RepID=UPI001CD206EE|nr:MULTISPECIES: ABC transporter ATP-binding protein [unclassified Pantoea]MCA1176298.1 ABC transporter ATP-binding protein [Pantoea sp. alder69]MCA1249268.1 ABC transporter ATP-binding protein [Pantoea sp. alder70]MCA1264657.1 ABC transporter ATP-binding protein [Pantoea sp. alder81]
MNVTPHTAMPVISVENLRVTAETDKGEEIDLVSDIRFTVQKGEVLALIGESGSGKTTIAMALMGYARHGCRIADGIIHMAGTDVRSLSPGQLREFRGNKVAYIAQSAAASFNPGMRIIDQVIEPVVIHGTMKRKAAKEKAIALFRELALPNPDTIGDRFPHQVSGGQLQRLMTAMALIGDPDVVILDEPTTALDVTTQVEVLKAFRRVVAQRGVTAIYVSHDLAVVAQMADRILVLLRGKMAEYGTTERLIGAPQAEYTQLLMAAARQNERESSWTCAEADAQPLMEVRDLSAGYGPRDSEGKPKTLILEDINLKLWKGQAIGIIGESGSGKTTLAHAIAGLNAPSHGHILFNGHYINGDMHKRPDNELRRIQYVFQMADTALNPAHSVERILSRPLALFHGLKGPELQRRLHQLLDLVKLPRTVLWRRPWALSGGQKQRVNLARALAAEPDLILCDEVTSALDTVVAAAVLDLISELRRELGLSVLFISHDMHAVRAVCDDIVVMKSGRIVTQISRADYDKPTSELYFERLKRAVPELRQGWLDEHEEVLKAE